MTILVPIVLAAGASTRMGQPKALLEHRGHSFLELACAYAAQVRDQATLVVTGAVELSMPAGAVEVHNADWEQGQLSSLQTGLREAVGRSGSPPAVLVTTVDRPIVSPATVSGLVAAWRGEPDCLWQPRHAGQSGHPIIYPPTAVEELLQLAPTRSAREVVRAQRWRQYRRYLDVDDPGVVQNIDSPADLELLDG